MSRPKPQTIGELIADLPVGVWVDLPEHGVRIRHTQNPVTVDVIPVPVIRTTLAEFRTERFWAEHIDPVARAHGIPDYEGTYIDPGDRDQHLLKGRDGELLLVVRTDQAEDA